jgi:hypothetical protein
VKKIEKARPDEDEIRSFFGMSGVAMGLRSTGWEASEEVERLVGFSRDPDPKVAMAAMKQLRGVVRETAEINGIIQSRNAEVVHTEGNQTVRISSTSKIVQSLQESQSHVQIPESLPFAAQYLPARDSRSPSEGV